MRGGARIPRAATWSVRDAKPGMVWIVDHDGDLSITNDAESVVRQVLESYPGCRIIYRDTDGNWDELKHDGARFTGFAPARDLAP